MSKLIAYDDGIYAIDADYVRPRLAAIHMIVENGHVAFVDTGCNSSFPNVLAALDECGLSPDAVDYVMLSHIHLDHAGGAGTMMKHFRNARLVVHPRGARHMIDPSKLMEGTLAVYGAEATRRLYGEILPIEAERIIEATHELRVELAGRPFLLLDTPGHAKHHIGIVDEKYGRIFSGDTFGLCYGEMLADLRALIFPTITPVQFEPDRMHASVDLLSGFAPKAIHLTHYGEVTDIRGHAATLHRLIDAHVEVALRERDAGAARHQRIRAGLSQVLLAAAQDAGCATPEARLLEVFDNDLELNAQGLGIWLDTKH